MHALYLVFNFFVVALPVLGTRYTQGKIVVDLKSLGRVYLFISVPFIAWDIIATSRGHWSFSEDFITGFRIFNLPLEEMLFFVTIPFMAVLIYEYILSMKKSKFNLEKCIKYEPYIVIAWGLIVVTGGGEYGQVAFLAALLILLLRSTFNITNRYYLYIGAMFGLFLFGNTILTAVPVVNYGTEHITGFRIGTIPIEDFLYNWVLSVSVLITYRFSSKKL